jgi:hypothetical protein
MIHDSVIKAGLDVTSLTALIGWWVGAIPAVATTLTAIWMAINIVEYLVHWWKK